MKFKSINLPIENEYPKLVRDNIPKIIKKRTGNEPSTKSVINDDEFLKYIVKKMVEEATELKHSIKHGNTREELADILELVNTILKLKGWTKKEIIAVQKEKREKNGGFKKRIVLK